MIKKRTPPKGRVATSSDSTKGRTRQTARQGKARRPVIAVGRRTARKTSPLSKRERFRGALLGLAAGDALGTTLEFKKPGTFAPLLDMVGGGPFQLKPGQWTDDTSMALCLAESLIEKEDFDPVDQLERYLRWWKKGHLSSNGDCFDIGNTVREALEKFQATHEPYCGPAGVHSAGNGSLMRLAPVPLFFSDNPGEAIEKSGESSRTTHQARTAIDACRYFASLLCGALAGVDKESLLASRYSPIPGYWDSHSLHAEIDEVASGSFVHRDPPAIRGVGFVVKSLEAALWAFHRSSSFEEGCLMAANLGDDADTTAAIYGQLAGAYYGEAGIPASWRKKLARVSEIENFADRLLATVLERRGSRSRRASGSEPDQRCPICGAEVQFSLRYAGYVCNDCEANAMSPDGRRLEFTNIDVGGGFQARYAGTKTKYPSHECVIEGVACIADEARFGGIVVQVRRSS